MTGSCFWLDKLCLQGSCRLYPSLKHCWSTVTHYPAGRTQIECRVGLPELDCSSTQKQEWCWQKNVDDVSQKGSCSGACSGPSKSVCLSSGPTRENKGSGSLRENYKFGWSLSINWSYRLGGSLRTDKFYRILRINRLQDIFKLKGSMTLWSDMNFRQLWLISLSVDVGHIRRGWSHFKIKCVCPKTEFLCKEGWWTGWRFWTQCVTIMQNRWRDSFTENIPLISLDWIAVENCQNVRKFG